MPPADISPVSQAASAPTAPASGRAAPPPVARAAEVAAPAPAPAVQAPEKLRIDPEAMRRQLQDVADMLNRQVAKYDSNLGFSVDEVANMHVVTVVNKESGEVIRKIPGEAALRIAHSIESLKGILYNRTI
jgi:flagellar protein FlaG